jgi:hypothetical protein
MKQSEAIALAKAVRPTDLTDDILSRFLSEIEGRVEIELHGKPDFEDRGLLSLPFPFCKIYWLHIVRMMDFAQGDAARYRESSALFEGAWQEYANYCRQKS